MALPKDYEQRVYAGVLGKIIGVYVGRPFEGWWYDQIMKELGEIWYYVHEKRGVPLIVTDDDISGTFTFVRALEDYGYDRNLTAQQIGQTWLNYIVENRAILWWGGMGMSTEHTAFLRLKRGIQAPESGLIKLNSKVVAEQIGAQIFIDGWAMVAPGDPALATSLARRAASVSHDGEAIYGAQVVAAIESMGFVESKLDRLLDCAVGFIPKDSIVYRMIAELRNLRAGDKSNDWHKAYDFLKANYGYDKYGGNCHMVPNHGLIIASLLWGDDSFQKAMMIVNTCGWDTDCNAANVGCIMGIKNGLAGIDAGADYRGPVADRLYLPTADGGRCISDALTEAYHLINAGRALQGMQPSRPKNGARFHFSQPGALQGFMVEDTPECRETATLCNPTGQSLEIRFHGVAPGRPCRVATPTFMPPAALKMGGYSVLASPTLYPGQTVTAELTMPTGPATARLYLRAYNDKDQLARIYGPELTTGQTTWKVPDTASQPIAEIGIEVSTAAGRADGMLQLHSLAWSGVPDVTFDKPKAGGTMWQKAWVDGGSAQWWGEYPYRFISNEGLCLLIQGTREWTDYRVSADVSPHLATRAGIAARVQGLKRFYALLLSPNNEIRLVKSLDGEKVLGKAAFPWEFTKTYKLELSVKGNRIQASADGKPLFDVIDNDRPLAGGAIALACVEGRLHAGPVRVQPA